jgi:hypothetical protein
VGDGLMQKVAHEAQALDDRTHRLPYLHVVMENYTSKAKLE